MIIANASKNETSERGYPPFDPQKARRLFEESRAIEESKQRTMRGLESISSGVSDNNEETRDESKPESSSAEESNYSTSSVGSFAELMTQKRASRLSKKPSSRKTQKLQEYARSLKES